MRAHITRVKFIEFLDGALASNFNPLLREAVRLIAFTRERILTFVTHVGGVETKTLKRTVRIHAHMYANVVRPNLFNPIKEPRRQSFERLLGRLKVTRVFVSSHLTHTGCVTGYETIRRTRRQWQAALIWKRSTHCMERRGLIRVEGQRFRVDYEESGEPIRRRNGLVV